MSDSVVAALISAAVAVVVAMFGTIMSNRIALQGLEAQAKIKKDELEEQAKIKKDELEKKTRIKKDELEEQARLKKDELESQARLKKDELEAAAARLWADAEGDRFAVSPAGSTAVMVETATGKTWLLHHSADGSTSVWLPAERIDESDEARKWLARQEIIKRELARGAEKGTEGIMNPAVSPKTA